MEKIEVSDGKFSVEIRAAADPEDGLLLRCSQGMWCDAPEGSAMSTGTDYNEAINLAAVHVANHVKIEFGDK